MMTLVFLQVLEPFCPLSEQENSDPEELEANQPTGSATVLTGSQTELNCCPLSSDSSSPAHNVPPHNTPPTETDVVSVPPTVDASPSFSDAESALPSSLPDCTSASQPCLVSVPPLSSSPPDAFPGALPADDDSRLQPQTQSDSPISHPFRGVNVAPLSNVPSDESNCAPNMA